MKISKSRIKHLISESIVKVLKESDEEAEGKRKKNEIYTKLMPSILGSDESFESGLAQLGQMVSSGGQKIKAEEAIKEIAEDLFAKIKQNPPVGDKDLEDRANQLDMELMKIERRDGQGGDEYWAALSMYEDAASDYAESMTYSPVAKRCHSRLERILQLIGLNAPPLSNIHPDYSFSPQDDPLLNSIDVDPIDYDGPYVSPDDLGSYDDSDLSLSYDTDDDDDDWLY